MSHNEPYDIFIVGGGINGCGIARDAAGRGFSVALAEMNDLASGTSSGSTKLIHGGLRYLEFYEFRLVREALREREVLWAIAPHIIWPLRFILPHHKGLRPAWLLRLGLFIYDHLGGRVDLASTKTLDLTSDEAARPLKKRFLKAFEYADCWVDDARLVILNAKDAANKGAKIMPRTKVTSARRVGDLWQIEIEPQAGSRETVAARFLINATGPWVDKFLKNAAGENEARNVRLVQGSHIIVKRLFDHEKCYIFQADDGRIIFAIPYEQDYTLIGTTDREFADELEHPTINSAEVAYLCTAANEYFKNQITPDDVVHTFAAVRPLYDDGASKAQEATRDYVLKLDETAARPPLLNVFGGKITTYRKLAESALVRIEEALGKRQSAWTRSSHLPGGDFDKRGFHQLKADFMARYPFLKQNHARRLLRLYGRLAHVIIGNAVSYEELGHHFGGTLWQAEVDYLVAEEWAKRAEDILWRRTKEGLRFDEQQTKALAQYLQSTNQNNLRQSA